MFLTTGIFGNFEGWRGEFLTFKTGIAGGPAMLRATLLWLCKTDIMYTKDSCSACSAANTMSYQMSLKVSSNSLARSCQSLHICN